MGVKLAGSHGVQKRHGLKAKPTTVAQKKVAACPRARPSFQTQEARARVGNYDSREKVVWSSVERSGRHGKEF